MKLAISIFILFFTSAICACECSKTLDFSEKYVMSSFVAEITIIKNYPIEDGKEYYISDIEIDHLYKGSVVQSIKIFGSGNWKKPISSCDVGFKEDTKLLIYSRKNKDGEYSVSACSGHSVLTNSPYRKIDRELQMLKDLDEKNINYTSTVEYRSTYFPRNSFEEFRGIKLEKDYAIFQINFDVDMNIESVDTISGFDNPIDQEIREILEKSKWTHKYKRANLKRSMLVNYFYYATKDPSQSFLSTFNL